MINQYLWHEVHRRYKGKEPKRSIARSMNLNVQTVRRLLRQREPQKYKRSVPVETILNPYKSFLNQRMALGAYNARSLYKELLREGYAGGYETVKRFVRPFRLQAMAGPEQNTSNKLDSNEQFRVWMQTLQNGKANILELERQIKLPFGQIKELYDSVLNEGVYRRKRAIAILSYFNTIPRRLIIDFLMINRSTFRSYLRQFHSGGLQRLFIQKRVNLKKYENPAFKNEIFSILHSPPSEFKFNRTTWRQSDLRKVMQEKGLDISKPYISKIIRQAGYRYLKAKKVLRSNDPEYKKKISNILEILRNLRQKEKFFSVDEYGPFAIRLHGGTSLVPPCEQKIIPQYQRSKGRLIITAALELSTNQITHFYSEKKNSEEMIKLLEILVRQYESEECIYFSWDAASWHASKSFMLKLESINRKDLKEYGNCPTVKLAPLPTGAQFLNVIESVFSGMARAIIHNSNYSSVDECMSAVDRYFLERNQYFKENPRRAGKKIWGVERVEPIFNESNNCKDPIYR